MISWVMLLVLLLLGQVVLLLWRPRGWNLLVTSILTLQLMILCMTSVMVMPVLVGGALSIRDEWQKDSGEGSVVQLTTGTLLPYRIGEGGIISTSVLHGPIAEWAGIDYARSCGMQLVAPADMIVLGVGENDGAGNTSLRVRLVGSSDIELGYVHGRYSVAAGDYVVAGRVFGTTASIGVSTGCHDHLVLWERGVVRDISSYSGTTGRVAAQKPLIMSSYNPHDGGINCEWPCEVTATGELVEDWWGAGAACIKDWTDRGVVVVIDGRPWKCIDTGGDIVETDVGIWVDLLTKNSAYAYGSLVYNWEVQ